MDDAELQLLGEIRDSLRLLPNELVQRLERARGDDEPYQSSPAQQQAGSPPAPAWHSAKSEAGAQIEAMEKFGFALGRIVPEFGQLASFSQSIRGIFDAWENLNTVFAAAGKSREDEAALRGGSLAGLIPAQEQQNERKRYGKIDYSGLSEERPGWTAKTSEAVATASPLGPPLVQPAAPLAPIPGLQSGPPSGDQSGPGAPPQRDAEPLPGAAELGRGLSNLRDREKAESVPSGIEEMIAAIQRQAAGWSAGQAGENARFSIEQMAQPLPISSPTEPERPEWATGRPAAIAAMMGLEGGTGMPQRPESGRSGMGAQSASMLFPDPAESLGGSGGDGIGSLVEMFRESGATDKEILNVLRELLRAAEAKRDGDEDETESVENLPPEKRGSEGDPAEISMGRERQSGKRPDFGGLKALTGAVKGGSDIKDIKDIMEVIKLGMAFL